MGCFVVLLGLITPRFVLFLMWLFSSYLDVLGSFWWGFLGFIFLPTTTLMVAVSENEFGGVTGAGVVLVILGVLIDIGLMGGGARARSSRAA